MIIGDCKSQQVTMLKPIVILFTTSGILVKNLNFVILMILARMMYYLLNYVFIYSVVCTSSYYMLNVIWNLNIAMILYVMVINSL